MLYLFGLNLLALVHFVAIPLVGMVLALKHWRSRRRLALTAAAGFLCFIAAACLRALATTLVLLHEQQAQTQGGNVIHTVDYFGLAAFACEAIALVLMVVCVAGAVAAPAVRADAAAPVRKVRAALS
jgi:hypothetical protein